MVASPVSDVIGRTYYYRSIQTPNQARWDCIGYSFSFNANVLHTESLAHLVCTFACFVCAALKNSTFPTLSREHVPPESIGGHRLVPDTSSNRLHPFHDHP